MATLLAFPSSLIKLHSTEGQKILENCQRINTEMIKRHNSQINKTYCGPASLALLSNSISSAYRIKYMTLTQEDKEAEAALQKEMEQGMVLVDEDDILKCIDPEIIKKLNIDKNGLTLEQLGELAMHLGFGFTIYYAINNSKLRDTAEILNTKIPNSDSAVKLIDNIATFRETIIRHISPCSKDDSVHRGHVQGAIVNFHLGKLGFTSLCGHISPIAAYSEEKDMFLVMDVWPEVPPFWVSVELLWENMSSAVDEVSGLTRGFIHVYELL